MRLYDQIGWPPGIIRTMRKVLQALSVALIAVICIFTAAIGWYQAVQISEVLPASSLHSYGERLNCKPLCDNDYHSERFSLMANSVAFPLILSFALPLYFGTRKNPVSNKRAGWICAAAVLGILIVHLSGYILYEFIR
jgi:hypothetical protein